METETQGTIILSLFSFATKSVFLGFFFSEIKQKYGFWSVVFLFFVVFISLIFFSPLHSFPSIVFFFFFTPALNTLNLVIRCILVLLRYVTLLWRLLLQRPEICSLKKAGLQKLILFPSCSFCLRSADEPLLVTSLQCLWQ